MSRRCVMRRSFWLAQPACMQPTHAADGMQASHAPSCSRGPARPAYACVPVASPLNHLAARTSCAAPIARRPCLVAAVRCRAVRRLCCVSVSLRCVLCGRPRAFAAPVRVGVRARAGRPPCAWRTPPGRDGIQTRRPDGPGERANRVTAAYRVCPSTKVHLLGIRRRAELRVCAVSCLCRLLVPVFLSALRKTRV